MCRTSTILPNWQTREVTENTGEHALSVRRIALSFIAVALVISGCSSGGSTNDSADQSTSSSPTPTPTPTPTWPLTGIVSKAASKTAPVLVIKVENDPSVRPQSGLDRADVVFEELVEGGITRFCTMFQSSLPKEIGPVRSVRHVDASIASPVADFFIFSGGARPTLRYVRADLPKGVKILTEGAPGMYRSRKHYAPHNLFLNPQVLVAKSKHSNTPTDGIFYRDPNAGTEVESSTPTPVPSVSGSSRPVIATYIPVTGLNARFSNSETPRWVWNQKRGEWLRFESSRKHTNTAGVQLGVPNLVILNVKTIDAGYRDPAGNYVPRTVFTGTGKGYVLENGQALAVKWSKPALGSQVTLTDVTGKVVTLSPGRTWVELIPNTGSFTLVKKPAPKPTASK